MENHIAIEKLVFGGQGLGRLENKVAFIWGALPGEEVDFHPTKKKKQFIEGVVDTITKPSAYRVEPREKHYLICSPWQTINFAEENKWKIEIAKETYQRLGGLTPPEDLAMHTDNREFGYRNKLEYSFTTENGKTALAFHERGRFWKEVAVPQCDLGSDAINETSHAVLAWINELAIPANNIKSMIVRSNEAGETIAALFVKEKIALSHLPKRGEKWLGFHVYFSNPLSPAAIPTELLASEGQLFLTETINGKTLRYGLLSFFQVNQPVFKQTVEDIAQFVDKGSKVIDYYSGVGSISLPIAEQCGELTLIENNKEAAVYAEENIALNNLKAKAIYVSAEKETSVITSDAYVILDPPRAGLHGNMVKALLEVKPKRIIYLSCDLATQARDAKMLAESYKPVFWRLYNFFPRTPHIEGLIVFDRLG